MSRNLAAAAFAGDLARRLGEAAMREADPTTRDRLRHEMVLLDHLTNLALGEAEMRGECEPAEVVAVTVRGQRFCVERIGRRHSTPDVIRMPGAYAGPRR